MPMRIALGADHRAADAVRTLADWLVAQGHEVTTDAVCDAASCDYPENAWTVATAVANGTADRGIVACGSGIGVSIAANKVAGIRAALVHDANGAEMCRRHNDANVLCFAAETLEADPDHELVRIWLTTDFDGDRHTRRVAKIAAIDERRDPRDVGCAEAR